MPDDERKKFRAALDNEKKNLKNSIHVNIMVDNRMSVDYENIIDIIFSEVVMDEKKRFIDYEDFEKIMWTTNIDQKCVIHLY